MSSFEKVILKVEDVQGKKGTYWRIHTDDGKASNCFDPDIMGTARANRNKRCMFHYEKNGEFWNLTDIEPLEAPEEVSTKKETTKQSDPNLSFQQSYGKDILIALIAGGHLITPNPAGCADWINKFVSKLNEDQIIQDALDDDMPEGWDK